ncbi:UDP-2,3-diacylglucosamine diphosphatase [Helicobacter sp. MIT 14-3879]|uniref:UDP-2,3-diacylglucosamine diphosphatase n=1 Tax=Helicobacter sp. MIT 14-3879 TaxID=2040649 RepID=UPI000E1E85D5|nr:metallophosphoesterase [Helicobacter sp. MIT 14-3879]RDU64712.1 UDP-2,3-diacylglucosamine diphosphatase [Helicobacter sp. MIT 14-3879]
MSLKNKINITINNDAIFIADSHTQDGRDSLIYNLKKIKFLPSQIFLLGDISNILIGNINRSVISNKDLIDIINFLSNSSQVIYFEGNHDFHLSSLFPNVIKIPRKFQPLLTSFGDKKVLLSHGDLFLDKKYEFYIKFLTSNITSKAIKIIDLISQGKLYSFIENKVKNKQIRFSNDTESLIQNRILAYKNYIKLLGIRVDIVIEGHFHIGKIIRDEFTYISLPSFYFNEKIFKIADNAFSIIK